MKEIQLTQGKVALVDDEDYEELSKYKWYANKQVNGKLYAFRKAAQDSVTHKIRPIYMHRVIMNTPQGMRTDHINNDGLDNRKVNLRVCTQSENLCNRGMNKNNTSGFKGVYSRKDKRNSVWVAEVSIHGKKKYIGNYLTSQKAHEAYREACIKYHGEFANAG